MPVPPAVRRYERRYAGMNGGTFPSPVRWYRRSSAGTVPLVGTVGRTGESRHTGDENIAGTAQDAGTVRPLPAYRSLTGLAAGRRTADRTQP